LIFARKNLVLAACAALALGGCSTLPSQGPLANEVVGGSVDSAGEARYAIIDLTERVQAVLSRMGAATFAARFGDHRAAAEPVIGVGDQIAVTVFEAAAGGLFSAPSFGGVTAGAHSAQLPPQAVAGDGSISVPYAGRVRVAGLTARQVEREIVQHLTGKAIEPQAIVVVTQSVSNSVTVTGEVTNGARVPLTGHGDHVLDVIASVGGVRGAVHDSVVTLGRGGVSATVPMQALLDHPRENIFVRAGDVITVQSQPRSYSAFGATGRNFVIPFDTAGISLAEAIAKAGGLLDLGSDPEGVFLLRPEPASLVAELDPAFPIAPGQTSVNVVYRANMRDAATYFLARKFALRDKDILYVANAEANQAQKALQVFNSATVSLQNLAIAKSYLPK
jgi:polysaccharide export outer membrane protein